MISSRSRFYELGDEQYEYWLDAIFTQMCDHARALGGNLLPDTGPAGDGSIHPHDGGRLPQLGQRR